MQPSPVDQPPLEELPLGFVPRVEPQPKHRRFVEEVRPHTVMMKIHHARRLARQGETAQTYFPDGVTVITTTTIRDATLFLMSWTDELDILTQFQPDYHIPTDYSAYESLEADKRRYRIGRCLSGFQWMRDVLRRDAHAFEGNPPTLIPLLKGANQAEYRWCLQQYERADIRLVAVYAVQYFTAGSHARHYKLKADLEEMATASDKPIRFMIIGGAGPKLTDQYRPEVVTAAGQYQWRSNVTPASKSPSEMVTAYQDIASTITDNLDVSTPLFAPLSPDQIATRLSDRVEHEENTPPGRPTPGQADTSVSVPDLPPQERLVDQPSVSIPSYNPTIAQRE